MTKLRMIAWAFAATFLFAAPAFAVDGVVLINHAKALAGNVTPGDTPGYPVTLSSPGSYRLSGNLTVPASVNGIDATAVEVSIDLNGFRINGSGGGNGVHAKQRSLTVRNGSIRSFANGLMVEGALAIIEDMRIFENGFGVVMQTSNSTYARILNNTFMGNATGGILCANSCHIEGNYIVANYIGVSITRGTLLGNTIEGNTYVGILKLDPGPVGLGNTAILNNTKQVIFGPGGIANMSTNLCSPAC